MSQEEVFEFRSYNPRPIKAKSGVAAIVVALFLSTTIFVVVTATVVFVRSESSDQRRINREYSILKDEFSESMKQRRQTSANAKPVYEQTRLQATAIYQEELIEKMDVLIKECQRKYGTDPVYLKPHER